MSSVPPKPIQKFSSLSHSIVALSTAYQEYNPLFIKTLHSLVLLNGVDCIITKKQTHEGECERSQPIHGDGEFHVLPISKCILVGIITYCHYKANGSVIMIIDDGTGFCDCIRWIDDEEFDRYQVGNLVKIQAAIKILSLANKRRVKVEDKVYEGWTCVRELQIHSIHMVTDKNDEILHWLHCLQFRRRIGIPANEDLDVNRLNDMDFQKQIMSIPVHNGLETFNLLSEKEQQFILVSRGMEDSFLVMDGDERLFKRYYGRDCKCQMEYKDALLYCHCLATGEALDPEFLFRDALLNKLMAMESSMKGSLNGIPVGKSSNLPRLEFFYNSIFDDADLQALARNIVHRTKDSDINIRRLYTNTFKHLRNDGVLSLLDANKDIYLLMSKERVLKPAILQLEIDNDQWEYQFEMTGKAPSDKPPSLPNFLHKGVSSAKLRLLKHMVTNIRKNPVIKSTNM